MSNQADKKSKKIKKVHKSNLDDNTSLEIINRSSDNRKSKHEVLELGTKGTSPRGSEKKPKKMKRHRLDEMNNIKNNDEMLKESSVHDDEKKPKKSRKDGLENDLSKKNDATLARRTSPRKPANGMSNQGPNFNIEVDPDKNKNDGITLTERNIIQPLGNYKRKEDYSNTVNDNIILKHHNADLQAEIPLPVGIDLKSMAGVDVQREDVGNALQFLEFCAVFGKASDFVQCNC